MSTPKFYTLQVNNIIKETSDCVSIEFLIPENLQQNFQFQSGQYVTIKHTLQNSTEEIRRSYSICSAAHQQKLCIAVKQIANGQFSTYCNQKLKIGDTLEVMSPMGNFISTNTNAKNYFGFASGSGITPVISILKNVLNANNTNTFTLVYGNKNVASIIFKEELDALKNIYLDRLQIIHLLSREQLEVELNFGRINTEKCNQLFETLLDVKKIDEVFICGPEQMTMQVKDFLIAKGVDAHHIKFELFGTDASFSASKTKDTLVNTTDGPVSNISIKVDDRTTIINLPYNGKSILDAALENGADLPFACKGGVCCTCRAKVIVGTVRMDVNYALEADEVANGFILTCQAHPTSEKVVVDFDVR